ncbi:hypothetical protein AADG42_12475 [Ammonicoccus fulvus]|uniref:DUF5134 domain-containing protein n=1 Tax=Ammonicoccus fulvus TaxID=3138240 RepID=A0ABZ3FRR2_9ACTN
MFTLTDTPVKFVALLLFFTFTTVWSLYQLARRQTGATLVSNLAHLAMSVVMFIMVPGTLWRPFVAVIPLPVLVGFFGVCTAWFVFLGVRGLAAAGPARKHGWHALGHAGMFGAMTWHLAGMLVRMQAMMARGGMGHGGMDHGDHGGMGHGGMEHGSGVDSATMVGVDPAIMVAIVGIPLMAYLLIAAIGNLKNAITPSPDIQDHAGHEAAGHGHYVAGNPRLAALADFAMNFGMFWMSTGLMVPLLPFFSYLAF